MLLKVEGIEVFKGLANEVINYWMTITNIFLLADYESKGHL